MFRHRHAKGKLLSYMQITRWSDKTKRKFNQVSIFISFNLTWKWLNLLEIYCKKFWSKFELESRFYWRVDDVSQTTPFFTWTKKTLKKQNKLNSWRLARESWINFLSLLFRPWMHGESWDFRTQRPLSYGCVRGSWESKNGSRFAGGCGHLSIRWPATCLPARCISNEMQKLFIVMWRRFRFVT